MKQGWHLDPDRDDAEAKYVSLYFADVIRHLLRAIAATDATGAIATTAQLMKQFDQVVSNAPEGMTWHQAIQGAVNVFKEDLHTYPSSYQYQGLALRGAKYLAEIVSKDDLSRARISKAGEAIEAEIRRLQRTRDERLNGFD